MNTETGEIKNMAEIAGLPKDEQTKYVPIMRDLSKVEEMEKQIKLYSPCGCGSEKKFKFCCYQKAQQ